MKRKRRGVSSTEEREQLRYDVERGLRATPEERLRWLRDALRLAEIGRKHAQSDDRER